MGKDIEQFAQAKIDTHTNGFSSGLYKSGRN